jgi:hypothetical protein
MNMIWFKTVTGREILVLILLLFTQFSFSQKTDSTKKISHFSGAITATSNGISLVPTFSLNRPAVMFNLSIGKGKLSFEPDMRFSMSGKPWSFLFWWRYRMQKDKFHFTLGAHPALNFRTQISPTDGNEMIVTRRFLASELAPNYFITKNTSIGMYYLYSRCFDKGAARNTHFITLSSNFRNIRIGNQLIANFIPQFYYLKQDKVDGVYFTSTLTLAKRNFPFSVQSIINKEIESEITGSKNFVWNVSLIYSFSKQYIQKK